MRALLITDAIRDLARDLAAHAEAHPLPWSKGREWAIDGEFVTEIKLADRPAGFERMPTQQLLIPQGYRVAFSIEEQPAGFCRHLSVSVDTPGRCPSIPAVKLISGLFGMVDWHKIWLEEFDPGHNAVNILELYKPHQEGQA